MHVFRHPFSCSMFPPLFYCLLSSLYYARYSHQCTWIPLAGILWRMLWSTESTRQLWMQLTKHIIVFLFTKRSQHRCCFKCYNPFQHIVWVVIECLHIYHSHWLNFFVPDKLCIMCHHIRNSCNYLSLVSKSRSKSNQHAPKHKKSNSTRDQKSCLILYIHMLHKKYVSLTIVVTVAGPKCVVLGLIHKCILSLKFRKDLENLNSQVSHHVDCSSGPGLEKSN